MGQSAADLAGLCTVRPSGCAKHMGNAMPRVKMKLLCPHVSHVYSASSVIRYKHTLYHGLQLNPCATPYLTKIMGKYAFGSWGASGARSGIQRLKGVGGVGGSDNVEYALRAVVIAPIASVRPSCCCCCCCEGGEVAVTEVASVPSGAAILRGWIDEMSKSGQQRNRIGIGDVGDV